MGYVVTIQRPELSSDYSRSGSDDHIIYYLRLRNCKLYCVLQLHQCGEVQARLIYHRFPNAILLSSSSLSELSSSVRLATTMSL